MDATKTIPAKYAKHLPAHLTAEDLGGCTFRLVSGCVRIVTGDYACDETLHYRGREICRDDMNCGYYGHYTTGGHLLGSGHETLKEAKAHVDRDLDAQEAK